MKHSITNHVIEADTERDPSIGNFAHLFIHPACGAILPGLLDIGLSPLIGEILPNLCYLLDPVAPRRVLGFEVRVVLVGKQDHSDGRVLSKGLVALPLQKLIPR